MGRPVVLSNGGLFVGLNEQGLVQDFYFPYVGQENLTNARSVQHKIGVWIDGTFAWVDDVAWEVVVDFDTEALISNIRMTHHGLGLELAFRDFVDSQYNAFCRLATVTNQSHQKRDVRIFMHQVFQISRGGRADTALYEPEEHYILDYKGQCTLLAYGQTSDGVPFDQFAIGNYAIEGKEGTFRDAEDGELSGSPIEHGGVDSVMRLCTSLEPQASDTFSYWVVASDTQYAAEHIHKKLRQQTLAYRLEVTQKHWHRWLQTAKPGLSEVSDEYLPAVKKSLLLIKAHIDKRGGVLASGDSSIYNYGRDYYGYVWPRDAAFALWPLIRLGFTDEARRFFDFCCEVVHPDGYMLHKYQPDRSIGSTWHPLLHGNRKELAIQEDETAIVLYMIGEYLRHTQDTAYVRSLYDRFIKPAANFMAGFIDVHTGLPHASYDLWEQKFLTNTYTVAVTYQALVTAAHLAKTFDYAADANHWQKAAAALLRNQPKLLTPEGLFCKGFLLQEDGTLAYDNTLDVSDMYGVMMFGYQDDGSSKPLKATIEQIERVLLDQSPSGGLPRYEYDGYFAADPAYKGNPWFVCTLWLAQYYIRIDQLDRAKQYLTWTLQHSYTSGVLSEQVNPSTGYAVSVAPLVWSHAELVNTILDLFANSDE